MTTDANLTPVRELSGKAVLVTGAARADRMIEQCGALAACGDVRAFTVQTRD